MTTSIIIPIFLAIVFGGIWLAGVIKDNQH